MSAVPVPAEGAEPMPLGGRARATLGAALRSRWFAYGMLALLQLRVVWGIWDHRDLTPGDTSSYFLYAAQWHDSGRVNLVWSPLYTMYYGSLMFVTQDPYAVTLLHRLAIAFAAGQLVLAVLRRLLPPAPAWLAAAWWTVLPTNYNTCYEVHLFILLVPLVVWLLLLAVPGRWARGGALATLCAAVVLLRNEMAVAAGLFACACAVREWRARRAGGPAAARWRDLALAYGAPLAAVAVSCALLAYYSGMTRQEVRAGMRIKHTLNMSQVYVFSYEQRHPEYTRDPWGDYQELMTRDFGEPLIPLTKMIRRNPRAVAEHFLWNWSLVPTGLEVLLFNGTSTDLIYAPDYPPVTPRATWPRVLLVLVVCCWIAGAVHLVRDWRHWGPWVRQRAWGWVGMLAVAAVALPVITTQRPRPSYLLPVGVILMAATATSLYVLAHRWAEGQRLARWLPLAMLAIIAIAPTYREPLPPGVSDASVVVRKVHRPLRDVVKRLRPYRSGLPRPDSVAVVGGPAEAGTYVWRGRTPCTDFAGLEHDWTPGKPLAEVLDGRNAGLLYLDENALRRLELSRPREAWAFLNGPLPGDWKCVAGGNDPGDRWRLYTRDPR